MAKKRQIIKKRGARKPREGKAQLAREKRRATEAAKPAPERSERYVKYKRTVSKARDTARGRAVPSWTSARGKELKYPGVAIKPPLQKDPAIEKGASPEMVAKLKEIEGERKGFEEIGGRKFDVGAEAVPPTVPTISLTTGQPPKAPPEIPPEEEKRTFKTFGEMMATEPDLTQQMLLLGWGGGAGIGGSTVQLARTAFTKKMGMEAAMRRANVFDESPRGDIILADSKAIVESVKKFGEEAVKLTARQLKSAELTRQTAARTLLNSPQFVGYSRLAMKPLERVAYNEKTLEQATRIIGRSLTGSTLWSITKWVGITAMGSYALGLWAGAETPEPLSMAGYLAFQNGVFNNDWDNYWEISKARNEAAQPHPWRWIPFLNLVNVPRKLKAIFDAGISLDDLARDVQAMQLAGTTGAQLKAVDIEESAKERNLRETRQKLVETLLVGEYHQIRIDDGQEAASKYLIKELEKIDIKIDMGVEND